MSVKPHMSCICLQPINDEFEQHEIAEMLLQMKVVFLHYAFECPFTEMDIEKLNKFLLLMNSVLVAT